MVFGMCLCLEAKFESTFQRWVTVAGAFSLAVDEFLNTDLVLEGDYVVMRCHHRSPVGAPTRTNVGEVGHAESH